MKVSVITVVYNSEDIIEKSLCSVINQDYNHIEYLIIDGGSTDNTLNIIDSYKSNIQRLITEPDEGIYDAMNKALRLASGDFLIFMNAGDTFFSDETISEFVKAIKSKDAVYYGDAIYINKLTCEKNWRGGLFSKYRLSKTNICHQTIFYPQKLYKAQSYKLRYKLFADWAYNIQLFKKYRYNHVNQIIAYYDSTGFSAINRDLPFEKDQKIIILKYLGFDAIIYLIYNKIRNSILQNHKY